MTRILHTLAVRDDSVFAARPTHEISTGRGIYLPSYLYWIVGLGKVGSSKIKG